MIFSSVVCLNCSVHLLFKENGKHVVKGTLHYALSFSQISPYFKKSLFLNEKISTKYFNPDSAVQYETFHYQLAVSQIIYFIKESIRLKSFKSLKSWV